RILTSWERWSTRHVYALMQAFSWVARGADSRLRVEAREIVDVRKADRVVRIDKTERRQLDLELRPDPSWSARLGEEDGTQGDVVGSGGEQLENVSARGD